jgi:integrase
MLGLVVQEVDPKRKQPATDTFGATINPYLDRKRLIMKPVTFMQVERHLRLYSQPLHHIPLADIDRRAIAQRLADIETNNGPVARNRFRANLSAMFGWAIKEGLIDVNPVTGTGKATENSRTRTLSPGELAQLLKSLPKNEFGDIVRMLVLTGQRREEIGALRWSEIDPLLTTITLPPERTKNKREHVLPLSKPAMKIIERWDLVRAAPRIAAINKSSVTHPAIKGAPPIKAGDPVSEFVFGRRFTSWSIYKSALDKQLSIPPWHLHDLRRSVATLMAEEIGVLPHIIEAILNHVSGHKAGVAGIYNRAKYIDGMREALEDWGNYVIKLEKGD